MHYPIAFIILIKRVFKDTIIQIQFITEQRFFNIMERIKFTLLIGVFFGAINTFAQETDCNCNLENYMFIDSVRIEKNLIDEGKAWRYLNNRNEKRPYLLITNEEDYKLFKTSIAGDIDFIQYNVFAGFFESYSRSPIIPIKFSLLFDTQNKQHITSIVQTTYTPYLKRIFIPYFIVVIIPKKHSNKICYTQKFIEITQNEN